MFAGRAKHAWGRSGAPAEQDSPSRAPLHPGAHWACRVPPDVRTRSGRPSPDGAPTPARRAFLPFLLQEEARGRAEVPCHVPLQKLKHRRRQSRMRVRVTAQNLTQRKHHASPARRSLRRPLPCRAYPGSPLLTRTSSGKAGTLTSERHRCYLPTLGRRSPMLGKMLLLLPARKH